MKIRNTAFLIEILAGSIENGKEKILEFLDVLIAVQFLFDQLKRALDRSKVIFDRLKIVKQNFLVVVQKG